MNPKNTKEAVEELQAAFGDLEGMVGDAWRSLHNDTIEVLNHVGSSVAKIVVAVNRINKHFFRCGTSQVERIQVKD